MEDSSTGPGGLFCWPAFGVLLTSGGAPRLGRFRGVCTLVLVSPWRNALARRASPPEDVSLFLQQRCVPLPEA